MNYRGKGWTILESPSYMERASPPQAINASLSTASMECPLLGINRLASTLHSISPAKYYRNIT